MKKNGEFVGVDDKFIPENEKYVDESIIGNKEESARKAKKIVKGIGIGYICWLGIGIALMIGIFIFIVIKANSIKNDILSRSSFEQLNDSVSSFEQQKSLVEQQKSLVEQQLNDSVSSFEQQKSLVEQQKNDIISSFPQQ